MKQTDTGLDSGAVPLLSTNTRPTLITPSGYRGSEIYPLGLVLMGSKKVRQTDGSMWRYRAEATSTQQNYECQR